MRPAIPARRAVQKSPPSPATLPEFLQAADLVRPLARISRLTLLYVVLFFAAAFADQLFVGWHFMGLLFAGRFAAELAAWAPLKLELIRSGTLGLVLASLLTALAGIVTTRLVVRARAATLAPAFQAPAFRAVPAGAPAQPLPRWRRPFAWLRGRRDAIRPQARPRFNLPPISHWAAWPQTMPLLALLVLAAFMLWRFRWVAGNAAGMAAMDVHSSFLLGVTCCALTFPLLIAERHVAALEPARLPEAPALKALLFLPVVVVLGCGLVEIAQGLGLAWAHWLRPVLACYLALVMGELALRTLGVFFQPPPQPHEARAAVESLAAKAIRPASVSPTAISQTIRDRFGIDFSRSWALAFVRQAAAPVTFVMLIFCWGLTGITNIGLAQRGVYERFGAPVAVLKPGLHAMLPWPFGRVRLVDYGVLRTVAVGREQMPIPVDTTKAEAIPPASDNRLWDSVQGSDVDYLIASRIANGPGQGQGQSGQGQSEQGQSEQGQPGQAGQAQPGQSQGAWRQSFETVSADLTVIYRIGMDDASARHALYNVADPQVLVGQTAGRLLSRFFASQTLNGVLGEDRQVLAHELQTREQAELDKLNSGIQVVSMLIETIHPPAGAAEAYHNVQAAEIVADTSIADERGRAESTLNVARQQARNMTNRAESNAADVMGVANVALTNFSADETGYRIGGKDFLTERYLSDLKTALTGAAIEIVDDRLQQPNMPIIDLRPPGAAGMPMGGATP
ncbi:MAG TPA: SPFH domain-containing protein [Stellaceae bacterium]|jgi:regulator of protease activity HflC (stomatin/prohibitin superfamily)|nr:SPFH domain-containing protein [Stellaceae bacterium]